MGIGKGANRAGNLGERDNARRGPHADRLTRHAKDDAGFLVLGKGRSPGIAHFAQAARPIIAHTREDDPERI
jgi:hypothetical protein